MATTNKDQIERTLVARNETGSMQLGNLLDETFRAGNAAIAAPTGGATQDAECRAAVAAMLAALRAKGLIGT